MVEDNLLRLRQPEGGVQVLEKAQLSWARPAGKVLRRADHLRRIGKLLPGVGAHPERPSGGLRQEILPEKPVLALPAAV